MVSLNERLPKKFMIGGKVVSKESVNPGEEISVSYAFIGLEVGRFPLPAFSIKNIVESTQQTIYESG